MKKMLAPSEVNIPTPDSIAKVTNIMPCRTAGSGSNDSERGGIPIDIDEREKNTVV
jgi:hypothetical protein